MIKCKVIEKFSLKDFNKLKNIERVSLDTEGELYVGDQFECDQKMADYLTGNNILKKTVVEIIEVDPESEQEVTEQEVQAVAEAIVQEALESKKSIEQVVQEINDEIEQQPKPKKKKNKKK